MISDNLLQNATFQFAVWEDHIVVTKILFASVSLIHTEEPKDKQSQKAHFSLLVQPSFRGLAFWALCSPRKQPMETALPLVYLEKKAPFSDCPWSCFWPHNLSCFLSSLSQFTFVIISPGSDAWNKIVCYAAFLKHKNPPWLDVSKARLAESRTAGK